MQPITTQQQNDIQQLPVDIIIMAIALVIGVAALIGLLTLL